jgi:hypothetical protein
MLHSRQTPRATTMHAIYKPDYGFTDRAIMWAVCVSLAVAAAIAVLTVTAIIYG